MSEPEVRQFILRLPADVHDDIKHRAELLGWSMAEWVRRAVDHYGECKTGEASDRKALIKRLS